MYKRLNWCDKLCSDDFEICSKTRACIHTHTFNSPVSRTTRVSWYQKGKANLDFTEARDSEWQWHQLGHMQVCTSLQTDNHSSTPPLNFVQAGCPFCRPTNSVKALKANRACILWLYIMFVGLQIIAAGNFVRFGHVVYEYPDMLIAVTRLKIVMFSVGCVYIRRRWPLSRLVVLWAWASWVVRVTPVIHSVLTTPESSSPRYVSSPFSTF